MNVTQRCLLLLLLLVSVPCSEAKDEPTVRQWPAEIEVRTIRLDGLDRFLLRSPQEIKALRAYSSIDAWLDTLPPGSWIKGSPAEAGFYFVWHAPARGLFFGPINDRQMQRANAEGLARTLELLRNETKQSPFSDVQVLGVQIDDPAAVHTAITKALEIRDRFVERLPLIQLLAQSGQTPVDTSAGRIAETVEGVVLGNAPIPLKGQIVLAPADLERLAEMVAIRTLERGAPKEFNTLGLTNWAGPAVAVMLPNLGKYISAGASKNNLRGPFIARIEELWKQPKTDISNGEFRQMLLHSGMLLLAAASVELNAGAYALVAPSIDPSLLARIAERMHIKEIERLPILDSLELQEAVHAENLKSGGEFIAEIPAPLGLLDETSGSPGTNHISIQIGQRLMREAGLTISTEGAVSSTNATVKEAIELALPDKPKLRQMALRALGRVDPAFTQSALDAHAVDVMAAALGNAHLREVFAEQYHASGKGPEIGPLGPDAAIALAKTLARDLNKSLPGQTNAGAKPDDIAPAAEKALVDALARAALEDAAARGAAVSTNLLTATANARTQLEQQAVSSGLPAEEAARLDSMEVARRTAEARASKLLSGDFNENLTRTEVAEMASTAQWNSLKNAVTKGKGQADGKQATDAIEGAVNRSPTEGKPGSEESKDGGNGNGGSSSWLSGPLSFKMPFIEMVFRMLGKYLGVEELAKIMAPVMGALLGDIAGDLFKALEKLNNAFGKDLNSRAKAVGEFLDKFGKFIEATDSLLSELATKSIAELSKEKLTEFVEDRLEKQVGKLLDKELGGTVGEVLHFLKEGRLTPEAENRLREKLIGSASEHLGLPPELRKAFAVAAAGELDLDKLRSLSAEAVETELRKAISKAIPNRHIAAVVQGIQEMQRFPEGLSPERLLDRAGQWAEQEVSAFAAKQIGVTSNQVAAVFQQIREGKLLEAARALVDAGRSRAIKEALEEGFGVKNADRLVTAVVAGDLDMAATELKKQAPAIVQKHAEALNISASVATNVSSFVLGTPAEREALATKWMRNASNKVSAELQAKVRSTTNRVQKAGTDWLERTPLGKHGDAKAIINGAMSGDVKKVGAALQHAVRAAGQDGLKRAGLSVEVLESLVAGNSTNLMKKLHELEASAQSRAIELLVARNALPVEAAALLRAGALDRAAQLTHSNLVAVAREGWERSWEIGGQALKFEDLLERSRKGLPLPKSVARLLDEKVSAIEREKVIRQLWLTDIAREILPSEMAGALSLDRFDPDVSIEQFTASFAQTIGPALDSLGPEFATLIRDAESLLRGGASSEKLKAIGEKIRDAAAAEASRSAPAWLAASLLATDHLAAAKVAINATPKTLGEVLDQLGWLTDDLRASLPERWADLAQAQTWLGRVIDARLNQTIETSLGVRGISREVQRILNGHESLLSPERQSELLQALGLAPELAKALAFKDASDLRQNLQSKALQELRQRLGVPENVRLEWDSITEDIAAWLPKFRAALLSKHLRVPAEQLDLLLSPDKKALTAETARALLFRMQDGENPDARSALARQLAASGHEAGKLAADLQNFLQAPSLSAARKGLPKSPEDMLSVELRLQNGSRPLNQVIAERAGLFEKLSARLSSPD